jgi:hypothetical protein
MNPPNKLVIALLSDTTFSRGEGTAGGVDTEVDHDEFGLPMIGGKTIRGLLRDSWLSMSPRFPKLHQAAERVLGSSQSIDDNCRLRIGNATLPESVSQTVRKALQRKVNPLSKHAILDAFTTIRFQTAENRETGAPEKATLRSSRVVVSDLKFECGLTWLDGYEPSKDDLQVLALCALATRHGGELRNRGRGHLCITLNDDLTQTRKYAENKR